MTNKNNERYSTELKATAIKKMMPPENCSDPQKLDFFGVEKSTLFFML
ncbi:TPA: hypothetical protein ACHASF_002910 [Enterococcus faecium]|nr:hypothetical protein [Enterococcus faecium]